MGLSAGSRLGPYEIIGPLGAGGMGEVYSARDTRLERTVAIKVLNTALVASPELKARFEREAKVISQLQHPHICVLHDVGSENGIDFLVMEYLEGESLAERLRRGSLSSQELLKAAVEIADALEKAHRAGVIHRDLKPGNVMLTKTGAKLLDFGLAKPLAVAAGAHPSKSGQGGAPSSVFAAAMTQTSPAPSPSSPLSAAGSLVGTVQYMSPEQIQGMEADARSDIFAFGVMLFEMATGKRAFEGKTQASIVGQILALDPPSVNALRPELPPGLDRVIGTCLEKDPEERIQTAHDVKLQLQFVDAGSAAAQPGVSDLKTRGVSRALPWAVAAVLAVAGTISGALYWREAFKVTPALRATIAPPEETTFWGNSQAISPDGTKWAFVTLGKDGKRMLWVRPLDSLTAQPLNGTEDAQFPFWSPDSRYIGFFATGKLKRIEASGGPAETICEATGGRGGTWNSDGSILFSPDNHSPLYRVTASGGLPVQVTKLDEARGEHSHLWPWFLPDGKHFLFEVSANTGENSRSVQVGSLDSPAERHFVLTSDWNAQFSSGYLLYWRDDSVVAQPFNPRTFALSGEPTPVAQGAGTSPGVFAARFSVSQNATLAYFPGSGVLGWQPFFADAAGKAIGELLSKAVYLNPAISLDGKRLAVTEGESGKNDVWVIDIARRTPSKLTFDGNSHHPVWAPDGSLIYYESSRNNMGHIFARHSDGSGAEQPVLNAPGNQRPLSASRDGRYLLYGELTNTGKSEVWVLPLFGDRKPFVLVHDGFRTVDAEFSPDGRYVAYLNDSTGTFELYITPFPDGGAKWQVTTGGAGPPHWRGDGKALYFNSAQGLERVSVTENRNSIALSTPQVLFQRHLVSGPNGPFSLASQDGSRFFVNAIDALVSGERLDAVVLTNWPAELKK